MHMGVYENMGPLFSSSNSRRPHSKDPSKVPLFRKPPYASSCCVNRWPMSKLTGQFGGVIQILGPVSLLSLVWVQVFETCLVGILILMSEMPEFSCGVFVLEVFRVHGHHVV